MSENYGYAGKILKVDLTTGKIENIPSSNYLPEYFGGRGLLAKLYWDNVPADIDPFDPTNCLVFAVGPLTGSGASQSAVGLCASKAPMFQKASYYVSTCGGCWPFEMKYAGYDAFVITGSSPKPVYLWVNDGKAELRDATFLKGRTTRHTGEELRKIHGSKTQVACIGPAGENKVVLATISTDSNTGFSQSGHGAVMGSKNLKAIAVRGTGSIKVAEPAKIIEMNAIVARLTSLKEGEVRVVKDKEIVGERKHHLPYHVDMCYPTHENTGLKREQRLGTARHRRAACPGCSIGCKSKRMYTDGSLPAGAADCGVALDWIEAEELYYGEIDGRANWEFAMLNDDLGLDMFMTGSQHFKEKYSDQPHSPSYATCLDLWYQGYKEGIITNENTGLPWDKFGSREFFIEWLHNITYRRGFGDVIANGMLYAVDYVVNHEEFGPNRAHFKYMAEKHFPKAGVFTGMNRHQLMDYGLGWFGYEGYPRLVASPVESLYCATSIKRGKEPNPVMSPDPRMHMHAYGTSATCDPNYWGPDVGKAVAAHDRNSMLADSVARCDFNFWFNFWDQYADAEEYMNISLFGSHEYLKAVFGREFTKEEVDASMEKLCDLERAIWLKEGYLEGPVDTFHEHIFEENDGMGNLYIPKEKFEQALQYYYEHKNWVNGIPKRSKLEAEGLKDVADKLEKEYGIVLPE